MIQEQPGVSPWEATRHYSVRRVVVRADGSFAVIFREADGSTFRNLVRQVKAIPGAQFEAAAKAWAVPASPHSVGRLMEFLTGNGFAVTPEVRARVGELGARLEEVKKNLAASSAMDAEIEVPGLGGELRPFQKAGVAYAVRNQRILLADEMGVGKTIQALATVHAMNAYPAVVVCPASLKINWYRESIKWLPGKHVSIWGAQRGMAADVMVINYDTLHKWTAAFRELKPKAVVFDESHYLKGRKARRTGAARELAANVDVRLCLSGTPVLNRPEEIVSQLEVLGRLQEFGGWWKFVRRYCAAVRGRFGLDTSGAANLEELNQRLRSTCYIRRMKADVLKELPPKTRSVVPLELDNRAEYSKAEDDLVRWLRENALCNEQEIAAKMQAEQLVKINALKRLAAAGKMKGAQSWIEDFLESGEKLVVFAHHVDVVEEIAARFNAHSITGGTSMQARQGAVDRFQNDPECRLIVLNIMAGGVGLTLTAASNVAFVELAWTPGVHDQAEDRCVAEGTPVMTPSGWRKIETLKVGDRVVSHTGEARKILAVHSRGAREIMAEIDLYGWGTITTTHDHRFLRSDGQWVQANDLRPGDEISMPGNACSEELIKIPFDTQRVETLFQGSWGMQRNGRLIKAPQEIDVTDDFLFVAGYFAGDGFASAMPGKGRFVSFSGNTGEKMKAMERCRRWASTHHLGEHESIRGKGIERRYYSAEWAFWFQKHFGTCAYDKRLPDFALGLNRRQSLLVLEGLASSDGYDRDKKGRIEYVTASDELAANVACLATRSGLRPSINKNTTGHHVVSWGGNKCGHSSGIVRRITFRHPAKINGVRERVWDITVDVDHSFVAGLSVVHNCHRIGQADSVTAWYLLAENSIDETIQDLIEEKRKVVRAVSDGAAASNDGNIMGDLVARLRGN